MITAFPYIYIQNLILFQHFISVTVEKVKLTSQIYMFLGHLITYGKAKG